MTSKGGGGKGIHQVNNCVKAEYQGDVNGFVGRVDEIVQDGCDQVAMQGSAAPQPPQQQLQGSLVHWERFLHVRSIKVMLVENDDCTRHIVTALLRNCNYEVIEAANGYQAWKILEDLSNHIDIVLTEVVMPSFSGISLLCKIMSHKTCKSIPVIIFKCLSKGAVDFLVKPIRKNELKNLWQHVWRRCHSSSGSGSESGTHAQKSVNSKGNLRYDDSGSKAGDDNGSTGDGSDDGSGTQSSWTKQAVELKSPEAASPCNQITEHPDSTCGLVIHPVQTQATWDTSDQEGQPYNGGKGKEIAIGRSRDLEMQTEFPIEVPIKHDGIKQNARQVFDPMQNAKSKDMELSDIKGEHSSNKNKTKASKMPDPRMENGKIEGQREPEKILDAKTKVIDDSDGVSEVSLKRSRATKHDGREVQNGCNTLRHSELSAFTRSETNKGRKYKTTSNAVKSMPGITASNSQPDNSSKIVKKESTHDAHSDGYLIYQGSNEQVTPRKADGIAPADVLHQELCIQHIHHHHHVHHYHNIDTELPLSNHDDFGLKELAADALHCGSSNIMGGAVHGNLENYNLNRSASGSRHGSNVQNGSDAAVTLEVTNVESDIGLDGKSASGDASGRGSRNRINHHKSAQREAALTKFLRKREV